MAWQFILTDLQGVTLGEVTNADQRVITLPHLRVPTVAFQIPLYHPRTDDLIGTDTLLKAYRTDNNTGARALAFNGPIVSVEEQTDSELGPSLACTAVGPYWRLTKRLIPGSYERVGGTVTGVSFGSAAVPRDLGLIAHDILNSVNAVTNGYTGIAPGTQSNSVSGAVGPWFLKNAAEGIAEVAAGLNSFEFVVAPSEPTASAFAWPTIGQLNVAPTIGTTKSDAIFEYGTGKANVASYSRQISRDSLLTRAWISANGWPDTIPKDGAGNLTYDLLSRDSDQITARGLFEEVVDDSGITDTSLRQIVADYHLKIRKVPRQVVTFKPAVNARPAPFVDYNVGDTVRARAVVRGTIRIDALFRIWGVTFNVDKNGNESVELDLVVP